MTEMRLPHTLVTIRQIDDIYSSKNSGKPTSHMSIEKARIVDVVV